MKIESPSHSSASCTAHPPFCQGREHASDRGRWQEGNLMISSLSVAVEALFTLLAEYGVEGLSVA